MITRVGLKSLFDFFGIYEIVVAFGILEISVVILWIWWWPGSTIDIFSVVIILFTLWLSTSTNGELLEGGREWIFWFTLRFALLFFIGK